MRREYLGDSYDAVKRLWRDLLLERAPIHATACFIPEDMREDYTQLTGIPILTDELPHGHSILNDPDVGIRLPGERNQREGRTHISVASIKRQLQDSGALCAITFDQSDYRQSPLDRQQQRQAKMTALMDAELSAFYYVSHAPFLFSFPNEQATQEVRTILTSAGMPDTRFEVPQVRH